jgi:hypothetical protein
MSEFLSRRDALKQLLLATGALGGVAAAGTAMADLPHLSADDPTAMALGYVMNVQTIDPKKEPTYQPGSICSNCLQLQGTPGDAWRPCSIFPGKLVDADGWCRVWVKKG